MPLILGTNSIKDTGFDVANSCRFGVNTYMHKVLGSDNEKDTWTFSLWVKRGKSGSTQRMMTHNGATSGKFFYLRWESNEQLHFHIGMSDGNFAGFDTTQVFRDHSAWYHIVCAVDTTQGTEANRVKIYVNGSQVTAFGTANYPAQNTTASIGRTDTPMVVGALYGSGFGITSGSPQEFYDGYLAEVCFIDDSQLAADSFGEFDSDSGIWKPKDVSGLTFGTDGFYLDFEDSGNLGNDANGGTDLTEVNLAAIDQSIDTCTNNFATLNPLDLYYNATASTGSTLTEGNLYYQVASGNKGFARSTFGVSAGKWYFEVEANSVGKGFYGVCHEGIMVDGTALQPSAVYYYEAVPDFRSGDQIITTNAVSVSAGDILGFALDMDNYALYISKNGTYMNSGNPGSGSSRTGAISELFTNGRAVLSDYGPIFANVANTSTTGGLDAKVNFGSPFYSESGGNADGNGFGNFKTAPPSGYLAFCTKNLAETGG